MTKGNIVEISEEVISVLKEGGIRCESFLEQVAKDRKLISAFCKQQKVRLVELDFGMENVGEEPFYSFSDELGRYTSAGLVASLKY
jgi:hypothetical protein